MSTNSCLFANDKRYGGSCEDTSSSMFAPYCNIKIEDITDSEDDATASAHQDIKRIADKDSKILVGEKTRFTTTWGTLFLEVHHKHKNNVHGRKPYSK
ncbi:hypothetical protein JTE90_009260 [Oedothorax gibbosus]|uniref:Uncharacterized protein n=1 Tax=Oedothorax gibbosus TaxID=931172 RepID=A0AAV6V312_9ARAC|nr:hypothetical protein JTE90_009260 [Oedothorax gibbosus]